MKQVAELSRYLALPAGTTASAKVDISDAVKKMEEALQKRVQEERNEFKKLVDKRMDAIEATVNKYIPPEITQEQREVIKNEAREEFEDTKEALTDLYC